MNNLKNNKIASATSEAQPNKTNLQIKKMELLRHSEAISALFISDVFNKYMLAKKRDGEILSANRLWERLKGDKKFREVYKYCKVIGINPKDLYDNFLEFNQNFTCIKFPFYLHFENVSYRFNLEKDGSLILCCDTLEHSTRSFQFGYRAQTLKGGK